MWHMAQCCFSAYQQSVTSRYQRRTVNENLTQLNIVDVFLNGRYSVTDTPFNTSVQQSITWIHRRAVNSQRLKKPSKDPNQDQLRLQRYITDMS